MKSATQIELDEKLLDAAHGNDIEGVRETLKLGADVNAKNQQGNTALILATCYGHTEVVKFLIAAKADVNITNEYGDTALIGAGWNDYIEIAKMLKKAGAIDCNDPRDEKLNEPRLSM